jgi:hypothetical protein
MMQPEEDAAVRQFLDNGGRITRCPAGVAATTTATLNAADLQRLAERPAPQHKRRVPWGHQTAASARQP